MSIPGMFPRMANSDDYKALVKETLLKRGREIGELASQLAKERDAKNDEKAQTANATVDELQSELYLIGRLLAEYKKVETRV